MCCSQKIMVGFICRQKKANENRLEAKKMKSQKKSDRRGKIEW